MAFQLYVWLLKYLVYKHTRESCDWNTTIININIHLEKGFWLKSRSTKRHKLLNAKEYKLPYNRQCIENF